MKKLSEHPDDVRIANAFLASLILVTLLDSMPYDMVFPVMIISPMLFNYVKIWRKEREKAYIENPLDG